MNDKPINQNPDRYTIGKDQWVVSASKDIRPLAFPFGEPLTDLKPVLEADGIIINTNSFLLCSKKTLDTIKEMKNPHYDVSVNGSIKVKDKEVKLGNTIPIIKVNIDKLSSIGEGRKLSNDKAGVESVTYSYDTEKVMGVPKGIVDQLNYTLVESSLRPGDTFSYWDWIDNADTKYNVTQLKIDNAQEDGKLDQKKLKTFISGVDSRLKALRSDFNSIKRTFFYGEVPSASGIKVTKAINQIAQPEDDIIKHQYVEKSSTALGINQSATQTAASSSVAKVEDAKKTLTDRIERTSSNLQAQIAEEQAKDSLQQQQIRQDLQAQITRNDAYYRERYGNQNSR